ncbi:MAG: hypothetical protein BYD32DRAFT_418709 [Podila humilis]|nr:MAG: hypothetical protein BYD32DRAFT_418709 [Podila humilis]
MGCVRSLDNHPSVTCLHIGLQDDLRGPNQERTVNEILYQRLDLINWSSVHTLKLCRRGYRPSDRELSTSTATVGLGTAPWPDRRSEKERRYMCVYFDDSVAILLNNGVLEIILPYPIMCEAVLPLCSRYSAVHSLHIRDLFQGGADRVLHGIPGWLPNLQHLDMDFFGLRDNELVEFLQYLRLRLSELRLWEASPQMYRSMLRPWLLSADSLSSLNCLHHTLTGLDLGGDGGFNMTLLLEVLARCVNLRDLGMYGVTTDGLELDTSPPWVCKL